MPLQIPQWLVLSGISPQAVTLYCLYKVSLASRCTCESVTDIPQSPDEYAALLHLDDLKQYLAIHHELIAVGAGEEIEEVDVEGNMTTVDTARL